MYIFRWRSVLCTYYVSSNVPKLHPQQRFFQNLENFSVGNVESTIGTWASVTEQRHLLNTIAKRLNLKEWQQWYQVRYFHKKMLFLHLIILFRQSDFVKAGGGTMLRHYFDGSLMKGLMQVFPEHP